MIKKIVSYILKSIFSDSIGSKPYGDTGSILYYEKSQHLMFMFKNRLSYESIIQDKAKKYIRKSDRIFDIGGNIGQYALLFSKLVGDTGKVISVEPDYKNFSFLQFNININNLPNVTCLKNGIGDVNDTLEFYRDTETGGRKGSFDTNFVGDNFRGFKAKVETITLDFLIEKFGEPDFVKIDVEGFESNVIKGLTKHLNNTVFLIEVREETKEKVFNYFQERGYYCSYIDNKDDKLITSFEQIPAFANLLFIRN